VIIIHSPHNAVNTMVDAGGRLPTTLLQKSQKDYKCGKRLEPCVVSRRRR